MRELIYEKDKINIDNGIYFGEGAFETILYLEGPIFLKEHVNRLNNALELLSLEKVSYEEIKEVFTEVTKKNIGVKILVTKKNIIVKEREITYGTKDYEKGLSLRVSNVRRNSTSKLTFIKWIGYIENLMEKGFANKEGYGDALFLNERGNVCETSSSNIFIIKNGRVLTPKIEDGLLGGIIREWIVKNFDVLEKTITLEEVLESDEVFVTNSLMGVMKVSKIENKEFNEDIYTNMIRDRLEGAFKNDR